MKIFTMILIPALLLISSFAWADVDELLDLRYCLALQSNDEIAKCAGETSAGPKGKHYTKDEVDKILSGMWQSALPVGANDSSPEKSEENSP